MQMMLSVTLKDTSWLGRLDPRVKIISLLGFVGIMSSAQSHTALIMGSIFLILLGASAGISPLLFLKRLLWILPFGGMLIILLPFVTPGTVISQFSLGPVHLSMSDEGLSRAVMLFLRMAVGLFAITMLTSTTTLGKLMQGMRQLRVPYIFVATVEFTVRYIFVLMNELKRMSLARKARGFESGRSLLHWQTFVTLGNQVGVLFLRASDRGERIYRSMLARGYSGETANQAHGGLKPLDVSCGLAILAAAVFLQVLETGGWQWLL